MRLALLLLCVLPGVVQGDDATLRVYYSGHSFHSFVPARVAAMVKEADVKEYQLAGTSWKGGSRVQDIWSVADDQNKARKTLARGDVDIFTMSPNVKMPDEGIDGFVTLGLKHNPTMAFLIQESWVPGDYLDKRISNNAQRDEADLKKLRADLEKWRGQMEEQAAALNKKAGRDAVRIVPVGDAVLRLRELVAAGKAPGVSKQSELFSDPTGHGTGAVLILTAYCNYACITGRSPVGLRVEEMKVSKELNALLQTIAWETVTRYPHSGVKATK